MRWPKRAASNGYDLGRDAPFGIVRLPAHSSWLGDRRGAARGASFLFGRRDGDRTVALRRLRQWRQVRLGGRKWALAVRPDRLELIFCRLEQDHRGLAVLAALVGELDGGMDRIQLAGAGSLLVVRLDRPLPLAFEHDELAERQASGARRTARSKGGLGSGSRSARAKDLYPLCSPLSVGPHKRALGT